MGDSRFVPPKLQNLLVVGIEPSHRIPPFPHLGTSALGDLGDPGDLGDAARGEAVCELCRARVGESAAPGHAPWRVTPSTNMECYKSLACFI